MSEYLWDKTGEDEEVERLEELLSEFRHRPRALELPAEAGVRGVGQFRAPGLFRPARLAAAAALLLAVLAGALLVIRRGAPAGGVRGEQKQTAAHGQQGAPPQHAAPQTPPPVAAPASDNTTTPESELVRSGGPNGPGGRGGRTVKEEGIAGQAGSRKPEVWQDEGAGVPGRRGRVPDVAFSPKEHDGDAGGAVPGVVSTSAPTEGVRLPAKLEERQRLAKDDLMYALRLTGLKLKEVQRKTQKVDGWKSAFDEQKPK